MQNNLNLKITYFGGEPLSMPVLEELKKSGILPNLVICNPDRPSGRKKQLTPPPTKVWAEENGIEVFQPESYKDEDVKTKLASGNFDLFVVVAYNKILPKWLIDLPKFKTINVHPSLLPKLRGPSPIRSAILNDQRETGVSIIVLDEEMDHGPIIAQAKVTIPSEKWPISGTELDMTLGQIGGKLLAKTIPNWTSGNITPTDQDHSQATLCTKITKNMGELQLDPYNLPKGEGAYKALLKIRAFAGWPETFFIYNDKRFKIKEAVLTNSGQLVINKIVPEGKSETDFSAYFK
ncbi:MAG: methionyl-tRNA formyltransferase [Candidatus Nomurabacteria bacterium]|nr:MAG: methionyl-tRNA formyltransferase [Candidatus Nomurabacteria bacterium]